MIALRALLCLVLTPAAQSAAVVDLDDGVANVREASASSTLAPGTWRVKIAEGLPPVAVPADEELVFSVVLDLGWLGEPRVGTVTLSSRVEEGGEGDRAVPTVGHLGSRAEGAYLGYRLDHQLGLRLREEGWPRIDYSDTQNGSRSRERRILVGSREGRTVAIYERDGHCKQKKCRIEEHMRDGRFLHERGYHCPGCKLTEHRVWRPPVSREVPGDTVDMLSAVSLARSGLREGREEITLHLINKDELWVVTVLRGERRMVETPSGRYAAREVKLIPTHAPGEEDDDDKKFEGLFGLHGSIQIWFHDETGVPVSIRGTIPVGPLKFGVRVELERYRGTPPAFAPER